MVAEILVACMDYRYNSLDVMKKGGGIVRNAGGDVKGAHKTIEGIIDDLVSKGEKEIVITVLVHWDCGAMKCLLAAKTRGDEDVNKPLTEEFDGFNGKTLQEYEAQNKKVQEASIDAIARKKEAEHKGVHIVARTQLITLPAGHDGEHKLVAIPVSSHNPIDLEKKLKVNLGHTYIISVDYPEEADASIATAKKLGIESKNMVNYLRATNANAETKSKGSVKMKG